MTSTALKQAQAAGVQAACSRFGLGKVAVSSDWIRDKVRSGAGKATEDRVQDFAMNVVNPMPTQKRMLAHRAAMEAPSSQEYVQRVMGPKKPRVSYTRPVAVH